MVDPAIKTDLSKDDITEMVAHAQGAADYLKVLSNKGRLLVLCHLVERERSVAELERLLAIRQPTISQMLARLRLEGLVETRREGTTIYYRLVDDRARCMLRVIYDTFCAQ